MFTAFAILTTATKDEHGITRTVKCGTLEKARKALEYLECRYPEALRFYILNHCTNEEVLAADPIHEAPEDTGWRQSDFV